MYHGAGGFAPFQSLYERAPGVLAILPLMPEWYLLIALSLGIALLGFAWQPLLIAWPVAIFALLLTVSHALTGGREAIFETAPPRGTRGLRLRLQTAGLYLLQPLARLCGRLGSGLTAWRGCAAPGFVFPRRISSAVWAEERIEPAARLAKICERLREEGNVVKMGGDYVRWDLDLLGGMFGSARLLMAVEDHGAGAQYVRIRVSPR